MEAMEFLVTEGQQWEKEKPEEEEGEEEEEEEDADLLSRKHRNQDQETNLATSIFATGNGRSNGVSAHVVEDELGVSKDGVDPMNTVVEEEIEEDRQQKTEFSVYYESDKGLWKCRNCSWDYQSGTGFTDQIQNPKRHWHMLINAKTVDQQGPCFIHETEGIGFQYTSAGEKSGGLSTPNEDNRENNVDIKRHNFEIGTGLGSVIDNQNESICGIRLPDSEISIEEPKVSLKTSSNAEIESSDTSLREENDFVEVATPKEARENNVNIKRQNLDITNGLSSVQNNETEKHLEHERFCDVRLHDSEISIEGLEENLKSPSNGAISADASLIKENDFEVTELDVETVLKKQETHDLYCPNCNSCITKRVILRKRKRRIRTSDEDAKRNKVEDLIHSELDAITLDATDDQAHDNLPPVANDFDHQREPDIFRCLSCFSIFIPTGNGFKFLRFFGDKSKKVNEQDAKSKDPAKQNWFSSIFSASNKAEELTEQGTDNTENSIVGADVPSSILDEPNDQASPRQDSQDPGPRENVKRSNAGVHVSPSRLNNSTVQDLSRQESLSTAQSFVVGIGNSIVSESLEGRDNVLSSSEKGPMIIEQSMDDVGEKLDFTIKTSTGSTVNGENGHPETYVCKPPLNAGELAETGIVLSQHDGLKLLVPSDVGSSVCENLQMDQKIDATIQNKNTGAADSDDGVTVLLWSTPVPQLADTIVDGQMKNSDIISSGGGRYFGAAMEKTELETSRDGVSEASQCHIVQNKVEIHIADALKVDKDVLTSTVQDNLLLQGRQIYLSNDLKSSHAGEDTIITIESGQLEAAAPQTSQDVVGSSETGALQQIRSGGASAVAEQRISSREARTLDVIKSIVYGGLIESVTSLSVVTSAAGADAATLNVFALGLANIFGGLFVISHDLWDLKTEHIRNPASGGGAEQLDRYQELLGRRADFWLHASVALFSYLVFGLLPPLVYSFSFRESDDKDLKLLVVAAVSMICITLLAAGKVYVQRSPKSYFKTLVYFVTTGLLVSGVSYTVGSLLKRFLEQIGIFPTSSDAGLSLPGERSMEPVLGSY